MQNKTKAFRRLVASRRYKHWLIAFPLNWILPVQNTGDELWLLTATCRFLLNNASFSLVFLIIIICLILYILYTFLIQVSWIIILIIQEYMYIYPHVRILVSILRKRWKVLGWNCGLKVKILNSFSYFDL